MEEGAKTGVSEWNADQWKPGVYRHFKGKLYRLLFVAKHSETFESMVAYQALYGERGRWVRPAAMWHETVVHEGKQVPRFVWVGDDEIISPKD